ncbi:fibrinogen-like protein 1 [Gigantopelta aegis]|uniref:fibrinogen-like protein 1 n=1 Tax=Gigantopelta aegis TaxID=1735272 RepID=UPI001B888FB1|nr:fibrinogen-like protein 1 [Gigantopelta aegis]
MAHSLFSGILAVCLFLSVCSDIPNKKRKRGCKCMHRFLNDIDKLIDKKIKNFEEKYFIPVLNSGRENSSRSLSLEDRRWMKLNGDVHYTKEALKGISKTLQYVKDQVGNQKRDTGTLGDHFLQLNLSVKNLTGVVERLEKLLVKPYLGLTTHAAQPVVDPSPQPKYPRHCDEVYQGGGMKFKGDYIILIKPDGAPTPFKAVCKAHNGSGWTLIQRRQDGSVDFYRSWADYKRGFGDMHGEFWLGNDNLHYLTQQGDVMLRIELQDWDEMTFTATYDHFDVGSEEEKYKLKVSGYHGNAGDSLTSHWENHDGMAFSTKDSDNDGRFYDSCAHHYHGAWWFNSCFDSHLNGKYYHKGFHNNYFQRDGIQWNSVHQYSSLKRTQMMIKPSDRPKHNVQISNDV